VIAPPRMWPHVVIEDGPHIAGLAPGDRVAFAPDDWLFLRSFYWTDNDNGGERRALAIESTPFGHTNGDAWRVKSDAARIEHIDYAGRFGSGAQWQPATSDVIVKEPWTLRIVMDGPPLATVKTFGPHTAVHARTVGATYGQGAFSEWLLPADGARDVLVVTEATDGALTWQSERRRIGVAVAMLRAHAIDDIDREVAAGIVAQMVDTQPLTYVGFDGVARAIDGARSSYREPTRAHIYAHLTRGSVPAQPEGQRRLAEELAATRPAARDEIAHVVRALCADAYARERALVEECGVLAG
jgi:hypothetical protein